MRSTKKSVLSRVFRSAQLSPVRYIFGVSCSSLGILLSGIPFYASYRIIRVFLLASLKQTAVHPGDVWLWAAVTVGSKTAPAEPLSAESQPARRAPFHAAHSRQRKQTTGALSPIDRMVSRTASPRR